MTPLRHLRDEAAQKRLEVDAACHDLRTRFTLRGLADEAAALIMPHQPRVMPIYEAVKRHPVVAVTLLAGIGWLIKQKLDNQQTKKAKRRNIKS